MAKHENIGKQWGWIGGKIPCWKTRVNIYLKQWWYLAFSFHY
jgi:hypothetical protein